MASLDAGLISLFVGPKLVDDFAGKLGQQVDKAMGPVADKAASSFGAKLSSGLDKAGKGLTAGVTAPILAVGATAIAAGMEVDGAFDTHQDRRNRRRTQATARRLQGRSHYQRR